MLPFGGANPSPSAAPAAAAAPPAPPALSDSEQQQLLAALRQPLFLQTPLQGLLEHLVQRLGASAAASSDLQRRVASLERTHVSEAELLERVRELELRLEAPAAAATPFAVAQLAARVGQLEKLAARLEEDGKVVKFQATEVGTCIFILCVCVHVYMACWCAGIWICGSGCIGVFVWWRLH
jgi:hypothetical protein